jgi:SET domain-containing protein
MESGWKSVEVKATRVGRGVFARVPFEAEEVIDEITGQIIDGEEHSSDYSIDLGPGVTLEPVEPFRYLNHSCEPNCELVLWKERRIGGRRYNRLWLETLRPITAGEELTIAYGWPASEAIPCMCGSDNCRGWIVDLDELEDLAIA